MSIPLCLKLSFHGLVSYRKVGIGLEHIIDFLECTEHGCMVSIANHFADADYGESCELVTEVHGCLPCLYNLLLAALGVQALHIDIEALDNEVDDVLASDDLRLNLDYHAKYTCGQLLVDGTIEGYGVGEE